MCAAHERSGVLDLRTPGRQESWERVSPQDEIIEPGIVN